MNNHTTVTELECEQAWLEICALERTRKRRFRFRIHLFFWLYIVLSVTVMFYAQAQGWSTAIPGVRGIVVGFLMLTPMVALVVGILRGEARIERNVSREQGIYCLDCDGSPRSAGKEGDTLDWLLAGTCPHCGGAIARFNAEDG